MTLAFDPDPAGRARRFAVHDAERLLCEGTLRLHRHGRRDEPVAWDEAARAGDGIEARSRRDGFDVRTTVRPAPEARGFDVETVLAARAPFRVVSLWHTCAFPTGAGRGSRQPLDFAWSPNLQPGPRDVAGEHVFRSPCLVARHAGAQVALVPYLAPGLFAGPLRHALSFLDRACPVLEIGRLDHEPRGHVFYRATGRAATLAPGDELRLAFTLLVDPAAGEHGHRSVVRFIWKRWGGPALAGGTGPGPQVLPFDGYAREGFASTLERYGLWRGFTVDGRAAGGTCARIVRPALDAGSAPLPRDRTAAIALNYLLTPTMSLRDKARLVAANARGIHPHLWHNLFFNNLRTAFGMGWYARRWGDSRLAERAEAMRELALSAPAPRGFPPSVFTADPARHRWVPGTRVWFYTSAHHTADAAWTGTWMLHHHRYLEADPRLLERCRSLGEALLRAQLPSGAIPTWVRARRDGSFAPVPPLVESASSAAPGAFLAVLHERCGEERFLEAARRVADFVIERIAPRGAWHDAELFFSCSAKRHGWRDARSGIPPRSTFPLAWTADLMRRVHLATRAGRYLEHGRDALDLLLLFQQAWNAPFLGFDTRGGFGVMNTDAEWSDARQAQFATLLMDWYDLTGETELFHRGVAALRASFTLMNLDEHRALAPGNVRASDPADRGAVAENYGHAGLDAKIRGYVMPDWGAGSAASAAALAQARWGDLYLDARRGAAFGIDGCTVTRASFAADRADLSIAVLPRGRGLIVKASGLDAPRLALRVNGRDLGSYDRADLERGISVISVISLEVT